MYNIYIKYILNNYIVLLIIDVNECLGYFCLNYFICENIIGSYNCFCEEGFIFVGDSC